MTRRTLLALPRSASIRASSARPAAGRRRPHAARVGVAIALACATLGAGLVPTALAQDSDLDDLMGGFDDDFDVEEELGALEEEIPEWLASLPGGEWIYEHVDLGGSIAVGAVWSYLSHTASDGIPITPQPPGPGPPVLGRTDFGGLSRLDLDGLLQLDVELPHEWQTRVEVLGWYDFAYRINGRADYNGAVLDVYEWQVDSGEVYATGPISDSLDLTIGRKVVNWGRSDTFRVVDVVNPLDNKEPGLVDIEDLRRPRAMAKLDFQRGPWSAQLLVIPEHRYDRLPPPGSDFIPDVFAGSGLGGGPPIDDRDDWTGLPGFAGKFDGRFSGWDFSIYAAHVDETQRTIDFRGVTFTPSGPQARLAQESNRYTMVGGAGNVTRGPILVKAEMAYLIGIRTLLFDSAPLPPALLNVSRNRLDTMVGIEWYGPDQLTIALEVLNRHLFDHDGGPTGRKEFTPADSFETGLRISRPFFRERLDVTLLGVALGERFQDGGLFRGSAEWELSDAWKVEGGWLVFFGGPRRTLGGLDSNDRVYAELKYSF